MPITKKVTAAKKTVRKKTATASRTAKKTTTKRVKTASASPRRRKTAARVVVAKKKPVKKSAKQVLVTSAIKMDGEHKEALLWLIAQVVDAHKHRYGLRGLYHIDRLLDWHNQRYHSIHDKFDAIVHLARERDLSRLDRHFYMVVDGRTHEENALYQLLMHIEVGELKYEEAKKQLLAILGQIENATTAIS